MHAPRLAVVLLAVGIAGCGRSADSGQRHLSGTATFARQPIPVGRIYFLPDPAKGGGGAGGFAEIKDGKYDTRQRGAAAPQGPLVVRIEGFDGRASGTNTVGQPLFLNHEERLTVAHGVSTHDFDVPKSAARGLPKTTSLDPP